MKKQALKYYRSFESQEEATAFMQLLDSQDIPYSAETSGPLIDEVIVGTGLFPKAIIKLHPEDFAKVNQLIEAQYENQELDTETDYLSQLDDDELIEVLKNPDEWSVEDGIMAKKILETRGLSLSEEEIEKLKQERLETLRQGKKASPAWLVFYFLAIAFGLYVSTLVPFVGTVLVLGGMGMGYYYAFGKSNDLNGDEFFVYDSPSRNYGKAILIGGTVVLAIQIYLVSILL